MRLRRFLLAAALLVPAGLFVRHQWSEARTCEREFGSEAETVDYEICTEYGANPEGLCVDLEQHPFRCSEEFIGGNSKLVAARGTGLFQARLDCAVEQQVSTGTRCDRSQWDAWCAKYHGHRARLLSRCGAAGPQGREGAPPAEAQATISAPAGPLSGPTGDCRALTTYQLPGVEPGGVAVDDDGSVWFTEHRLGAVTHMDLDGRITRHFLGTRPGAITHGPAGDLWFTDREGNAIWRFAADGQARRVPLPTTRGNAAAPGGSTSSGPSDLVAGPDGNVWFIESEADQVGWVTPDLEVSELALSGPGDGHIRPTSITVGPDGSLWVATPLGRRIVHVDPRTLATRSFNVPDGGSGVVRASSLAVGSDGAVWFDDPATPGYADPSPPALGRMNASGAIRFHPLPDTGPRWPGSLTKGPDGAIWFLDAPAKTVGRMTPDGTLTEFPFAAADAAVGGSLPGQLAAGDRELWFVQPHTDSVGHITCRAGQS